MKKLRKAMIAAILLQSVSLFEYCTPASADFDFTINWDDDKAQYVFKSTTKGLYPSGNKVIELGTDKLLNWEDIYQGFGGRCIMANESLTMSDDYTVNFNLYSMTALNSIIWNVDYRGGGRASARETLVRVIASSIVEPLLCGISVESGVLSIGEIEGERIDFEYAKQSEIFSLDQEREWEQKREIKQVCESKDSIGGVVLVRARGEILGLGEPLYYKLDGEIARAMMGINGVKAVEIGEGINASKLKGSEYNDMMGKNGFLSNHSGGILAGVANGEEILAKIHFKPTPSIALPQKTLDKEGKERILEIKGRHDPCIAIRGSVVCEAMMKLVLADMILLRSRR